MADSKNEDIAIVYLVAGISKRFGGGIKAFAKVGRKGETLIEYSMQQALQAGFSRIYFVVGDATEKPFKERFGNHYKGIPINYAIQSYDKSERERPWGTTDALASLAGIVNCPFVVCSGDNIYGRDTLAMLCDHLKTDREAQEATIAYRLDDYLPKQGETIKGIFTINNNQVTRIREMTNIGRQCLPEGITLSDSCSKSVFALHPRVINMLKEMNQEFKKQHKGDKTVEYILPNALSELIQQGKISMVIYTSMEKCCEITRQEDEERVRGELEVIGG